MPIAYRDFKLDASGPVLALPIRTERGIAGAVLLGAGEFQYRPEPGRSIAGHQRAAVLRFNPDEQAGILPLDKGKKVTDHGAAELARHLLAAVVRHCYQRNFAGNDGKRHQEVLIPPRGALAVVVYSREHGDLLISFDDRVATVFDFTRGEHLYDRK